MTSYYIETPSPRLPIHVMTSFIWRHQCQIWKLKEKICDFSGEWGSVIFGKKFQTQFGESVSVIFGKKIHSTYFRPKIVNLKNIRFPGNEPASFLEKKSNHFFSFIGYFRMLTSYKWRHTRFWIASLTNNQYTMTS